MANTDPEALKAAQQAYERSNASLKDYNPEDQEALDPAFLSTRGGVNTHPGEPVTVAADSGVQEKLTKKAGKERSLDHKVADALKVQAKDSDSKSETAQLKEAAEQAKTSADAAPAPADSAAARRVERDSDNKK